MNVIFSKKADEVYLKLPQTIRKKIRKQIKLLKQDIHYPSLRVKKLKGESDLFEARIDYQYRLIFSFEGDTITVHTMGTHDTGLGKK